MKTKKVIASKIQIPKRYVVVELHGYGREAHTLSEVFLDRTQAENFFSNVHRHHEIEVLLLEEVLAR